MAQWPWLVTVPKSSVQAWHVDRHKAQPASHPVSQATKVAELTGRVSLVLNMLEQPWSVVTWVICSLQSRFTDISNDDIPVWPGKIGGWRVTSEAVLVWWKGKLD